MKLLTISALSNMQCNCHCQISGVLLLGGLPIDGDRLKTAEVFPSQNCLQDVCSVPDLPFGRSHHTLSVLSSGTFVVCGGQGEEEQNLEESGNGGNGENNSTTTSSRFQFGTLKTCLTLEFALAGNASWVTSAALMRFASILIFKSNGVHNNQLD